jgi:hypothetical protein
VRQPQKLDPVEELRDDAAAKKLDLAGEQQVPDRMIVGGE